MSILYNLSPKNDSPRADTSSFYIEIEAARHEWRESCVNDSIIQANVKHYSGDDAIEVVCGPALAQIDGHGLQYATGPVRSLLQRYDHLNAGGWWVSGLDPLNNWQRMEWGQFKPLTPRTSHSNPDKIIKYETPPKVTPRAIFLDGAVDWATVQADLADPRFWTEGAKTAGSGLSVGYNTIALPGVFSGYRSKDILGNPITPHLIPEVEAMALPGTTHYLAFDKDEKTKTARMVNIALFRFGSLLVARGCKVYVVNWPSSMGKGIDDLIANHGPEAFHKAVNNALTFDEWQLWQALDNRLTTSPSIQLKTHALTVLSPESVPEDGLIAIASAKATSKTNLIVSLIADKDKALLTGHRISLMRNLSERCAVHYRGDIDRQSGRFIAGDAYTLRIGTCVDSLLAFNPADFKGCDLVLDEVCQVLRHLLTSSTCNKNGKRPVLLMRFRELLQAARRVIIADADLDNKAIAYIQELRGDTTKPFLIINDYQAPGYDVRFIESPDASAITGELLDDLIAGRRIYIATDSRRSSKRVNRLISELQGKLPHLLINSETSGGPIERAFMENPDQHLSLIALQAVTASPSAGTGISIEGNHFDKVYGLFYGGSITDADMAQALLRVRDNVPRVVWCAKYGRSFSKVSRETSPQKLLNVLKQKTDANTLLIRSGLSELASNAISGYDWANDAHVNYWAKTEAERNRSMWNLRTALKVRLMHEGHQVTVVERAPDGHAKVLLKAARQELQIEKAINIEGATNLTPTEAKLLAQMDGLDKDQGLALEKWKIAEFYCLAVDAVDADLVLWDNEGKRRTQLRNLEDFIHPETATDSGTRVLENQVLWDKGITPWDLSDAALKRQVRIELGIDEYLEPGLTWDVDSLAEFKARALRYAKPIKAALNFTVKESMSGTQILHELLTQMGIVCISNQHRVDGERVRTYGLNFTVLEMSKEVLERRKARRLGLSEDVTPTPSNYSLTGVCDELETPKTGTSDQTSASGAAIQLKISTSGHPPPDPPPKS